jgi:hypothetical protein
VLHCRLVDMGAKGIARQQQAAAFAGGRQQMPPAVQGLLPPAPAVCL